MVFQKELPGEVTMKLCFPHLYGPRPLLTMDSKPIFIRGFSYTSLQVALKSSGFLWFRAI